MRRLLLLLPGLLGAAAGLVPGPRECAQGSAAWCRDLRAAARCGAVGHCRQVVWGQPAARSLACGLCRRAAAAGRGRDPEAMETAVLASVRRTCQWLRSQEAAARCQGMVDTQGAALLSMLGRGVGSGPREACAALTLCRPLQGRLATLGLLSPGDASDAGALYAINGRLSFRPALPPVCQDCLRLVTQLQGAVRSSSSLLAVSLQERCEPLGPGLALLCKSYIRQLSTPAEATLRRLWPEDICRQGGFCQEQRGSAPQAVDGVPSLELALPRKKSQVQMEAGLTCEVCLSVVQQLDQWLASNRTKAVISHALEHVCSFMPSSVAQQCVSLVDTYSPSLVQLVTRIAPEKVCTAIRLCGHRRRRARSLPPPVPPAVAQPEPPAVAQPEPPPLPQPLPRPLSRPQPPPRPLLQPRPRPLPHAYPTAPAALLGNENQGTFCNSCMRLLQESSRQLQTMNAKRDILVVLKSGCRILPFAYMMECNRFVTSYEVALLESLRALVDPVMVCKRVGACHAPRKPLPGTD